MKYPQSKNWCFTLNNYEEEEIANLKDHVSSGAIQGLVLGFECGESGTRHIQGYVEFPRRLRLRSVKAMALQRAHLEPRRGTALEAIEYCIKDGSFEILGNLSIDNTGSSKPLDDIQTKIRNGIPLPTIANDHFNYWIIYRKSFEEYDRLCRPSLIRETLKVFCLWGETGSGKTRYVYYTAKLMDTTLWVSPDPKLLWFDGYRGQQIALLDDYRGEASISFLLRVLDIYPIQVPIKGGFTDFTPSTIYITSNHSPESWYAESEPLIRRITKTIFVEKDQTPWPEKYEDIRTRLNE